MAASAAARRLVLQARMPALRAASRASLAPVAAPYMRSLRTFAPVRAANPQAGAPTSSSIKESAKNAGQEARAVGSAIASAISGNPESGKDASVQRNEGDQGKGDQGGSDGGGAGVGDILRDARTIGGEMAQEVPQPALLWGAAGIIPYVSTAAASVWLARQAKLVATGVETSLDLDTAQALLLHAENLQLTYGAVILSFLGAIHWGFEFSKYGGRQGNRRYALGVAPVVVAWPSLLLTPPLGPVAQWGAFVAIWFFDLRATTRGWAPRWYSTYRFWLTAFVGTSIIATLAGTQYYDTEATRYSPKGTNAMIDNVQKHAREKRELSEQARQGLKGGRKTVLEGLDSDAQSKSAGDDGDSFVKVENPVRAEEERKKKEEEERKKREEQEKKEKEQKDQPTKSD